MPGRRSRDIANRGFGRRRDLPALLESALDELGPNAQPLCQPCWSQRERTAADLERSASRRRTYSIIVAASIFAAWFLLVLGTCVLTG